MLNCKELVTFVDTFIDQEFDAQEHAEVEAHLAHCPHCRRLVEFRLQMKSLVSQSLKTEAPTDLKSRIWRSIDGVEVHSQPSSAPLISSASASSDAAREADAESKEVYAEGTPKVTIQPLGLFTTGSCSVAQKLCTSGYVAGTSKRQEAPGAEVVQLDKHRDESKSGRKKAISAANNGGMKRSATIMISVAAAALFVAFIPQFTVAPATSESLPIWEESTDWYRSGFPMEVKGPDSSQVTSWFKGKVDFPVSPLSFGTSHDTSLKGGRLASVRNQRAALLDYEVEGSPVSVLIFDGKGLSVPSDKLRTIGDHQIAVVNGPESDVAIFHKNNLTYTITADLPDSRFDQLIGTMLNAN